MVREFFVISCNEKSAQRWRQVHPRLGHPFEVRGRSVKEITGNEDHVGSEAQEHMDDTLRETVAPDMSKVHVADQGCHPSPPRFWEVRKPYAASSHANTERIDAGEPNLRAVGTQTRCKTRRLNKGIATARAERRFENGRPGASSPRQRRGRRRAAPSPPFVS